MNMRKQIIISGGRSYAFGHEVEGLFSRDVIHA